MLSATALSAVLIASITAPSASADAASGGGSHQRAQAAVSTDAETSASDRAAASGVPVEVAALTTQTSRTLANPDGTFTAELSPGPVRVRRGAGWADIDTTLERGADGVVRPRITAVPLRFSGGGTDGVLAQVSDGSRAITLGWAGRRLPEPSLSGDTATYADVYPGVDLVVTAGAADFTERLVVHDTRAAANPALRALRFPVSVSRGLTVTKSSAGGFSVVTDAGHKLFASPAPVMWDSSADAVSTATTPAPGAGARAVSGPAAGHASPQTPREGDKLASMPLQLSAGAVTVTPDVRMLTSSSTTFPVMIDPGVYYTAARNGWAMVNATYPTTSYWKFSGDEGVGYNSTAGVNKKRVFYMFSTSAINSKHLLGATFKAYETFAYSCSPSTVEAWETSAIYTTTTWNKQPSWRTKNDARYAAYGRDGCSPGGAWLSFDVLPAVSHSKALGGSNTTIGLRASSETSNSGWKRFRYDATLSINYNTPPATPYSLRTTYPSTSCVTGSARPVIPKVDPPTLNATISDSDGSKGQTVRSTFQITAADHTTVVWTGTTAYKAPGVTYAINAPTLNDGVYAWRAQAYDGVDKSQWSGWCEFAVDGTAPPAPSVTTPSSAAAGSCLVLPDAEKNSDADCAVSDTGSFTFSPGDATTKTYRWSLNSQTPTSSTISVSSPGFAVVFDAFGPNTVRVWGYDAAGNVSAPGELQFPVNGAAPAGWWRLDESTGALSDTSSVSTPHPLTRVGGTTSVPGHFSPEEQQQDPPFSDPADRALAFDGASGSANTSSAVLSMGRSITLSAWVKLDGPVSARRYLVSQDRGTTSWSIGIFADPPVVCATDANGNQVDPDCVPFEDGRYGMAVSDGTRSIPLFSDAAVAPGQWTHLVAVYNPGLGDAEMKMYVDGEPSGSPLASSGVPRQTTSTATGPFRVGSLLSSTVAYWWPGTIDEVEAFTGAYDDEQAFRLSQETRP